MDWSKIQGLTSKAKDIMELAKESLGKDDDKSLPMTEKSLFGNKEKEELDAMTLQLEEQKKKQETTLIYIIGGLVLLMFTGILKIGK